MADNNYQIKAKLWLYPGPAPWHFITLPKSVTKEIKIKYSAVKRGWGSLPVRIQLGNTTWQSSIFPDKKSNSYLLPIKAQVRKVEKISEGDTIKVTLKVDI